MSKSGFLQITHAAALKLLEIEILSLLAHQQGYCILLCTLPALYKETYNRPLRCVDYGFPKLQMVLENLQPGVVKVHAMLLLHI